MSYLTVNLVIDGAHEAEQIFQTQEELDAYIRDEAVYAIETGAPTQIYVLEHAHAPTEEECACIQFTNDLRPYISFNMDRT